MDAERWGRIEQLYHAALQHEPGSRPAFLERACDGDEELRRHVELLVAQDASGSWLNGGVPQNPDFLGSTVSTVAAGTQLAASARVFPGVRVTGYDVTPNRNEIAYVSPDPAAGTPHLWRGTLDGRSPPHLVARMQADSPCFAADGTLFFRGVDSRLNFVYRLDAQSNPQKVVPFPIIGLRGCSPDRQWLLVAVSSSVENKTAKWVAYPVSGGQPIDICASCFPTWSRDGAALYITLRNMSGPRTYAIGLINGSVVPKIPPEGITAENVRSLPVVHVYDEEWIHPGTRMDTYAVIRSTVQRNIYKIPLN